MTIKNVLCVITIETQRGIIRQYLVGMRVNSIWCLKCEPRKNQDITHFTVHGAQSLFGDYCRYIAVYKDQGSNAGAEKFLFVELFQVKYIQQCK